MAYQSFHDRLDAVWPADIRTVLGLSDSASVYFGRRPRAVKQGTEVEIQRLDGDDASRDSFSYATQHRYRVVVRVLGVPRGAIAGEQQTVLVRNLARQLVERYNGRRRLSSSISDIVYSRAEEVEADVDPEETQEIASAVEVTWLVKGEGSATT